MLTHGNTENIYPLTYSPQQIKKAVLMTAAYFKVVAQAIIALRLPLFTNTGVPFIKQVNKETIGFKSLPLNCSDVTQVNIKM